MLLDGFSVRPGHVFRKPCLIALGLLAVVGPNIAECKYRASCGLDVCDIMLFTTVSDCWFSRGTSRIPVILFLAALIISFPLSWTGVSYLSSVVVHPSSHKTPNDINGAVFVFGTMWNCLAWLLRPVSWSVDICEDPIVLPSGSIAVISFDITTVSIVGVAWFSMCIFAPECSVDSMLLLKWLGGLSIQFIKLILGILLLISFIIAPNHHLHPFSLLHRLFL